MTSFNGQAITYDAIGNPLTYRGWTLTWTGGRRLASIAGEGLTAAYTYNADGVRTQKTVNGVTTEYYLDGTSILRQVSGDDVLEFFYDTDSVLGFYYNGTPYYYLKNMQGDIVGILDSTGTQVVAYSYDAWGAPLSVTGTLADTLGQLNPFRYGSYYYDTETGLYYLNSRYYDAETGRFLNADGYVSTGYELTSCNMFAYCLNNPAMCIDSTGEFAIFGITVSVAALVKLCMVAASAAVIATVITMPQTRQAISDGVSKAIDSAERSVAEIKEKVATAKKKERFRATNTSCDCAGRSKGSRCQSNIKKRGN